MTCFFIDLLLYFIKKLRKTDFLLLFQINYRGN